MEDIEQRVRALQRWIVEEVESGRMTKAQIAKAAGLKSHCGLKQAFGNKSWLPKVTTMAALERLMSEHKHAIKSAA